MKRFFKYLKLQWKYRNLSKLDRLVNLQSASTQKQIIHFLTWGEWYGPTLYGYPKLFWTPTTPGHYYETYIHTGVYKGSEGGLSKYETIEKLIWLIQRYPNHLKNL